jgi:hypothetical protein
MPTHPKIRRYARNSSFVLAVLAVLYPLLISIFPEPVRADTPRALVWADRLAFEGLLVGIAIVLRRPHLELPFLVGKASFCFLVTLGTVWKSFESPVLRIGGSVVFFLLLFRVLPEHEELRAEMEE